MDKTVVSLMCENIKKLPVDVEEMVRNCPEKAGRFVHGQYIAARRELSMSLPRGVESRS